jgi:threonine/homoserine/homoserine lactone efflux protein
MLSAFLVGAAAGYGIAIPVGPIAVLILRTGLRRGFRLAAAAGAGTATADLVFATIALIVGAAVSGAIASALVPVRLAAAAVLIGLAVRGLMNLRHVEVDREPESPTSAVRVYLVFLGLTLLNPATVVYFVSLAVGLPEISEDLGARAVFVIGAVLASLSWQTLLAAIGAALHARLTPRIELATALLSSAILVAFALKIASDVLVLSPLPSRAPDMSGTIAEVTGDAVLILEDPTKPPLAIGSKGGWFRISTATRIVEHRVLRLDPADLRVGDRARAWYCCFWSPSNPSDGGAEAIERY